MPAGNALQNQYVFRGLSGSDLKIIACIVMTIDHLGVELFPGEDWMRIVGRLAFPIFAFFIAEGCRYTKNRLKRLVRVAALAALCEGAYYIYAHRWEGNILITFTFSIVIIYLLQDFKAELFARPIKPLMLALRLAALAAGIVGVALFNSKLRVDYGFWGVMVPVFVSLFDFRSLTVPKLLARLDSFPVRLICLTVGLLLLCISLNTLLAIQWWCPLAVPLVGLYNGLPGNPKLKNLFYIYYPLHLLIIGGISMLL